MIRRFELGQSRVVVSEMGDEGKISKDQLILISNINSTCTDGFIRLQDMLGMSRKPIVGLDPTLPSTTEEEDTESKAEESRDSRPSRLMETRSAKVAPLPTPIEPYTPAMVPSFLTLGVPGAAVYTPADDTDDDAHCPDLTPVHRLTKMPGGEGSPER